MWLGLVDSSDASETTSDPEPKHSSRKYVRWIALVLPALLAGLFSLIPNIFERFTAPEAALSYSFISSPPIRTPTGYSRIFSLTIENSGTTRITGVEANISVSGGVIDRISIGDSAGDRPIIGTADDTGRMTVRTMFPKERIGVIALATSINPGSRPSISVRSDQALGQPQPFNDGNESKNAPRLAAILAAVGAFIATIAAVLAFRLQRNGSSFIADQLYRQGRVERVVERKEAIMFIADLINFIPLTERLTKLNYDVMYVQFGDMLAEAAYDANRDIKNRMIAGLNAILIVPRLHQTTQNVIKDYIVELVGTRLDPTSIGEPVSDRLNFREKVRGSFVAGEVQVSLAGSSRESFIKRMLARLSS